MEDIRSIQTVDSAKYLGDFARPLYDSYCFTKIPDTIKGCLGANPQAGTLFDTKRFPEALARKVVLFYLDAFGWRFLQRYCRHRPHPVLRKLRENGFLIKLTSQFPATTTNQLILLNTGLPLCQTAVPDWYYYESRLDRVIRSISFSRPEDPETDTLLDYGIDPASIFPRQTIYHQLRRQNIDAYAIQPANFCGCAFNKTIQAGAVSVGYESLKEGLQQLRSILSLSDNPAYIYFYIGYFDRCSHDFGPDSPELDQKVEEVFDLMEDEFLCDLPSGGGNILLLFTADHGQTPVYSESTCYLDEIYPEIKDFIKRNASGELLAPTGSAGAYFLHLHPKHIEQVEKDLALILPARCSIIRTDTLLKDGIFGPAPHSPFLSRNLGDLVILSPSGIAVDWAGPNGIFHSSRPGRHGGMTSDEMHTYLLAVPA